MRIALAILGSVLVASAGCGCAQYDASSDDWASSSTSGTTTTTTTSTGTAGVDAGLDAGDPRHDRAMALFARSCTPCHRHVSPVDILAVQRGVFLETDTEILALTSTYTVGQTATNLASLIAQRAEGYDLLVGPDLRSPMPPRGSPYPPLTQDEAREITAWFHVAHGLAP